MDSEEEKYQVLSIGYRADATDADLREMTRTSDPVGEMTRALREAQAVYQPLPIPDVMKSLQEESIASQIPESVASIPRSIATLPESVLGHRRTVQERLDAVSAAQRDIERITGYLPRRGW